MAQVVNPYNPVNDFNNQWYGRAYGVTGQFNYTGDLDVKSQGWDVHGFLRQNTFFNNFIAGSGTMTSATQVDIGGGVFVDGHRAAWVQGPGNIIDGVISYNQRGASLSDIVNVLGNPVHSPHVGRPPAGTANLDYELPANFQGVANPAERQTAALASNAGLRGGAGYLSAFGRALGDVGYDPLNPPVGQRDGLYLTRDVNRTLFWTETGNLQTNNKYVTGVQFDVINQNSSAVADDRVTLAVRMGDGQGGSQWYIAAMLDPVHNVYADVTLPSVGDLNSSDLSSYAGPGLGAYTLHFDFKNYGADDAMQTRYVWYELTFDGGIGTDPTWEFFGGPDAISLDLPAEFGTEDPNTENPVYVTFSQEDLANAEAWGVFMRYAAGNRRVDNFFIITAPGGGATAAQKRTHAKAQNDARRAALWAHHVRTQQQQRAAQHRRNQQRN